MIEISASSKNLNFYILIFSMMSLWMTASTIYMVLPVYFTEECGLSTSDVGILIAMGTMPGVVSSFFAGFISDRIGRKPILLFGLFGYSSCFLLFYFFRGFEAFAITRFIEGLTFYVIPTAATAFIADIFPPERRGQAMGQFRGIGGIGRTVGPLIAGIILTTAFYPPYFIFCSLSVLVSAIMVLIFVRESLKKTTLEAQIVRSNLPTGGLRYQIGTLKRGFTKLGRVVFIFYIAAVVRSLGRTAISPLFSTFLRERIEGIQMLEISIFFSTFSAIAMVLSPFAGRFSDKIGRKPLLIGALMSSAAVLFLYSQGTAFIDILVIRALEGVTWAFVQTVSLAYLADLLPVSVRGLGLGIYMSFLTETSTIGAIFGGVIADMFGFGRLFQLGAILMLTGALIILIGVPEPRKMKNQSR